MTKKGVISVTTTLKAKHSCGQSMVEKTKTETKQEIKKVDDFIPLNLRQGVKCLLCERDMELISIQGNHWDEMGNPHGEIVQLELTYHCCELTSECGSSAKFLLRDFTHNLDRLMPELRDKLC